MGWASPAHPRRRSRRWPSWLALTAVTSTLVLTGGPTAEGADAEIATVSIGDAAVVEGNSTSRTVMVPVTLSSPQPTKLRVQFQTVAGTAKAGSDYTAKTGSIAIAAGKTAVNISVSVKGDTNAELDEQLTVRLTGTDDPGVAVNRADGRITLLDDDPTAGGASSASLQEPTTAALSIGDVTVVEGNGGTRAVVLPMTLSKPLAEPIVIRYATRKDSAIAPSDFRSKSGSTSIGAGKVFGTISIVTLGDDADEPDESFTVSLTSTDLVNTDIDRSEGRVTILNDDTPPRFVPAAPPAPTATLAGNAATELGQVDVTWTAPADDGNSPITAYELEVTSDGSTWQNVTTTSEMSHRAACELPGNVCAYRVYAVNDIGRSPASPASAPVTSQRPPATPDAPTATADAHGGAGVMHVSWTLPPDDGGAPVDRVEVEQSRDGGSTWDEPLSVDASLSSTSLSCGTLSPACAYRITAVNAVGRSAPSPASATVAGNEGPLNFIVIMTDDHSPDSVPYYMPYLDSLDEREQGVWTFDQAVATTPLCGPSRISFLTAMNVDHHGMDCNTLGSDQCVRYAEATANSYPVWLKSVGYSTSYNGKYINRYPCTGEGESAGWPNPPGWDDWHGIRSDTMAFTNKFNVIENGTEVTYNNKSHGVPIGPQAYGTYLFGDLAQQHIETCAEPCLTVYMPTAPHIPATLPHDYDDTNYPLPGMLERHPSWNEGCNGYDPVVDKPLLHQNQVVCKPSAAKSRSNDQRSLQAVDREIEDLVEAAKARGIWDRTVLIFTSDHGFQHHNNSIGGKQVPYEMSVRVPLVVRIPGSMGGSVRNLVTLTDVTATLADLAGATLTRPVDGRSFVPLLRDGVARRDAAYISMPNVNGELQSRIRPWFSIRQDCTLHVPCYKVVRYPASEFKGVSYSEEWELYDLTADPYELRNLLPNPVTGYPGVDGWDTPAVGALRDRLLQAMDAGDLD